MICPQANRGADDTDVPYAGGSSSAVNATLLLENCPAADKANARYQSLQDARKAVRSGAWNATAQDRHSATRDRQDWKCSNAGRVGFLLPVPPDRKCQYVGKAELRQVGANVPESEPHDLS